jgi:microcystin-dependent protein
MLFAGNFAPRGYALCNGQILPLSQFTALFSLLGTNFGGNGTSNFALPNLQGAAPIHQGQGPGLTDRIIGETGGEYNVTLLANEMPLHNHLPNAQAAGNGDKITPVGTVWGISGDRSTKVSLYSTTATSTTPMAPGILLPIGGNLPHNNLPPYLTINFVIATTGIYPARN